jgi:transcriptional regulator with XRE-family HTH domain
MPSPAGACHRLPTAGVADSAGPVCVWDEQGQKPVCAYGHVAISIGNGQEVGTLGNAGEHLPVQQYAVRGFITAPSSAGPTRSGPRPDHAGRRGVPSYKLSTSCVCVRRGAVGGVTRLRGAATSVVDDSLSQVMTNEAAWPTPHEGVVMSIHGAGPKKWDTIVCVSVYCEMPSPGAGLLRYARLKAGLSQSELAERAGVPRTMVSAYERDRRQATLPTLMRLLKAAGFELRMQLAPYDDHDDVLRELEEHRPLGERQAWEGYQATRVAKDRAAVSAALRARKRTQAPG